MNQRRRKNEREAQRRMAKQQDKARRELAKIVGDEQADQLLFLANKARKEDDLCVCSDSVDARAYASDEEAEAAKSEPAPICAICGKERLRLSVVVEREGEK